MKAQLATLTLGIALLSAACGDRGSQSAQADSNFARDLALASAQTPTPSFQDTAIAPAPVKAAVAPKKETPAPVRKPTPPAPKKETPATQQQAPAPVPVPQPQTVAPTPAPVEHGEIASGTSAVLTAGNKVCSGANMVGDKIVATLNAPITGSHGAEIPAGANVVLEVASITSGDRAENASITFRVRSVIVNDKTYNVSAEATPAVPLEKAHVAGADNGDGKKKVIGGAIAGAIIGQVVGRNAKGAIIGAAAGAATGAAVSKASSGGAKWEACLPSGAQMQFKLNAPLVLM